MTGLRHNSPVRKLAILAAALAVFGTAQDVIKRVEPEYSSEARAANLEGTLTVYFEVETSGKPSNVQVIQGLGMGLDEKAIEAVKQWAFQPAKSRGAMNKARAVELTFRLATEDGPQVRHTLYSVRRI